MNVLLETRGEHERRWKRYPAYRDSGVAWLGEVPEGWDVRRLKCVTECLDGQRVPLNAEERGTMQGEYPYWGANGILDYIDRWLFDGDLVLLGEDGAPFFESNKDVAFFVTGKIWVNNHAHILRAVNGLYGRFLTYCLNTVDYHAFIDGSTRDKLTQSDMNEVTVQFPADFEQRAITAFLDRETAKIDALAAKKERLVELFEEKRTALISHVVTKGLDPDAPMKDSGIEWLGEVPEGWEVKMVKWFTAMHKQGYYTEQAYIDEGVKLARITDIDDSGNVYFENMPFVAISPKDESSFKLKEGDFLFARSGTIGRFGVVKCPERSVFASYLILFRFKSVEKEFLRYAFGSHFFKESLLSALHGGANQNVHAENIKEQSMAIPPLSEQHAIAAFLDRETAKIDALTKKIYEQIDKLKEYRTALISAAVTGKIDVRGEIP